MAQEFLTTFADELYGVTLRPSETGGHYSIRVDDSIIFDRKAYGRFPEINELKQMLRDKVKPEKSLGHSDKK